jgi:hypothetical protein
MRYARGWRGGATGAAVALALVTSGCGGSEPPTSVACRSGTDAKAMCVEYLELRGDDYSYAMAQCREVGGELRPACPTEQRIGICAQPAAPTVGNVLAGPKRVHYYLHPDVANEGAIAALERRCGANAWTPEASPADASP